MRLGAVLVRRTGTGNRCANDSSSDEQSQTQFFFAPLLALVAPWHAVTVAIWVAVALAGLWLGVLGIAMATGLALVLRSNAEISEDYWRSIVDYPAAPSSR